MRKDIGCDEEGGEHSAIEVCIAQMHMTACFVFVPDADSDLSIME